MKWIIDTDYSSNSQKTINLLLKNKVDIIAITVSSLYGLSHLHSIKSHIEHDLEKNNFSIPVYAGTTQAYINYQKELNDTPLLNPYNLSTNKIEENPFEGNVDIDKSAALMIIELIKKHGKNLNILCLSQLTNLSLSILLDNSIKDIFNRLYIVGGSFTGLCNSGNASESSFRNDPVAAKNCILYYSNVFLLPLEIDDVASKSDLDFYSLTEYANDIKKESKSLFHIYASMILLNEKIIKKETTLPGDVDITGRYTRGALSLEKYPWIESGKYNKITFVEEVDLEKLKETLKESLTK